MEGRTYKKRKNCATMDGEWFEVLVALLVYLRLRNSTAVKKFRLASNVADAGAFDDVVFHYATDDEASGLVWHTCFVQLKHKVKAKLGLEQLFAGETKGFSLQKYFKSYNEVKGNMARSDATEEDVLLSGHISNSDFVLYTNAPLHNSLAHKKTQEVENARELNETFNFHYLLKSNSPSEAIFKFTQPDDQDVFNRLEGDEESVKEFLDRLTIFSGQCSVSEISRLIKTELLALHPTRGNEVDRVYDIYKSWFQVWWRDSEQYLDEASDVSVKCVSLVDIEKKSFEHLCTYRLNNINFSRDALEKLQRSFNQGKSIVHISTKSDHLKITTTKIQRLFEVFPALSIHATVEYFIENEDLVHHWLKGTNNTMVLVYDSLFQKDNVQTFINKIKIIIESPMINNKTIVLVTEENNSLINFIKSQILSSYYSHVEECFSYDELDDHTKECVGNTLIPFQNYNVSLKSFFEQNIEKVDSFLSRSPNLGSSIILGDIQPIGQPLPSELPCFIPRSLRMRDVVDVNIFKSSETTDIFFVTGVTVDKLSALMNGGNIFHESEQKIPIEQFNTTKFHKLEDKNHHLKSQNFSDTPLFLITQDEFGTKPFNHLCLSYSTVHWLHVESESRRLIWKRSQGDIRDVKRFVVNQESVNEQSCLLSSESKIEILIGEAGMGKTTLMESVARETKKANPHDWVVLLKLRQQSDKIANEMEVIGLLTAVGLSSRPSKLETQLFELALNDIGNVILICDGLDEICPQYEKKIFNILEQIIKKTKVKKIIISSRYSMQNPLETRFSTLSKEVVGLSEDDSNLLLNYYGIQNPLECIQNMTLNGNFLLTTPLLTVLFAEVFKGSDHSSQLRFGNVNLFNLVELFVESKFKLYFGKRQTELSEEEMKGNFFKDHFIAALKVFNDDNDLRSIFKDRLEMSVKNLESSGIIHSVTDHKPCFIHQIFAEYFAAYGLVEYTEKIPTRLQKYMFRNLEGFRYMINNLLAKDSELHRAVLDQDCAKLKELLSTRQSNVNAVDKKGRQLIHLAATLGFEMQNDYQERFIGPRPRHIVEILLNNGAKVNNKDRYFSWKPLKYALETSSLDAAEYLLANNASKQFCKIPSKLINNEVLCTAISNGFVNVLKLIISKMELENSIILKAFKYSDPVIVEALVSKIRKTNVYDRFGWQTTIGHLAAEYDQVELFQKLGSDREAENKTVSFLKSVIGFGENEELGRTYLHAACAGGAVKMVDYLLAQGTDVDSKNKRGETPLAVAARHGMADVIEMLVLNGADIDRRDAEGQTALHWASWWGRTAVVDTLVLLGADVDVCDNDGLTPLDVATRCGKREMVEILKSRRAELRLVST